MAEAPAAAAEEGAPAAAEGDEAAAAPPAEPPKPEKPKKEPKKPRPPPDSLHVLDVESNSWSSSRDVGVWPKVEAECEELRKAMKRLSLPEAWVNTVVDAKRDGFAVSAKAWALEGVTGEAPSRRRRFLTEIIGAKLYVYGGLNKDGDSHDDLYCLDYEAKTWACLYRAEPVNKLSAGSRQVLCTPSPPAHTAPLSARTSHPVAPSLGSCDASPRLASPLPPRSHPPSSFANRLGARGRSASAARRSTWWRPARPAPSTPSPRWRSPTSPPTPSGRRCPRASRSGSPTSRPRCAP